MFPLRKPKEIDEVALRQAAERGERAARLAQDESFAEAVKKVEAVYMEAWRNADPFDVDTRERAWIATKLLDDLRSQIIATVREGVAAQKQIEKSLRP